MSVVAAAVRALVPAGSWRVDPSASAVGFRVRHLMLASVSGRFDDYDATIEATAGRAPSIRAVVRVASLDTGDPHRDEHLRSGDFFDVARYPELSFVSTAVEPLGAESFLVSGELALKGVTRPVELVATRLGRGCDSGGRERVRIEARGELDRTEFGLGWNATRDTGGFLVADEVELELDLSAVRFRQQD